MLDVTRGAGLAFALKIVGASLAFAFNVAIGRLVGADGAGLFFLALSIATVGSIVGRVGLDNALLRFTAIHSIQGEWGQVAGVYSLGMKVSFVASGSIALVGLLAAPWMATVLFQKPELGEPLRWMSLSILPFSLLNLHAECLKGVRRIRDAMLVQSVGLPLIGLLLVLPFSRAAGVTGISWAYLLATCLIAGFAAFAWRVALAKRVHSVVHFSWSDLLKSCKPLFVTALMNRAVLPWAPLFLLGIWASTDQVGIYGAASRVAMLVSFALATVNSALVPKLAELYSKGDMQRLARTARRSALFVTLLASPLFVAVIVGNHWVMGLFGSDFRQGGLVLAILALGQLINALTGSVNHILIVTGNEFVVRNVMVLAAAIMLLLCLLLAPLMGAVGVAIATATATAGLNLAAAYVVWKKLGVVTLPFLGRSP
jgi:O-antigen/teichoic acid export membrane protein